MEKNQSPSGIISLSYGPVAQLVSAEILYISGSWFESKQAHMDDIKLFASVFNTMLITTATVAAALSAWFSYQTSKDSYVMGLHKLYFDIVLPIKGDALIDREREHVCNFFETLCHLKSQNKIKDKDLELHTENMKLSTLVNHIKQRRKERGEKAFEYYYNWLLVRGIV